MSRAQRDQNYVPTLIGVSFVDLVTPEPLAVDPVNNRLLVSSNDDLTVYDFEKDDTGVYTYLGNAAPGTADSAASWRIARVVNATGVMKHADGVGTFSKVWDDRASYTY